MALTLSSVQSSNLELVGYDTDNQLLAVQFKGGALYVYHQVPNAIWAEMQAAESKGSFLALAIKNKFKFTHIKFPEKKEVVP